MLHHATKILFYILKNSGPGEQAKAFSHDLARYPFRNDQQRRATDAIKSPKEEALARAKQLEAEQAQKRAAMMALSGKVTLLLFIIFSPFVMRYCSLHDMARLANWVWAIWVIPAVVCSALLFSQIKFELLRVLLFLVSLYPILKLSRNLLVNH